MILELKNISKSFVRNTQKATEQVYVIKDLDLTIEENKITALIGGNGAGKTTLFNIISRFLSIDNPKQAQINFYNGKKYNLLKFKPYQIPRLGIGRLFQDTHVFPELTVLENLLVADGDKFGETPLQAIFSTKIKQKENARIQKAKDVLAELYGTEGNQLLEKLDQYPTELSGGWEKLLAFARLFMSDYKLILLDEPTASLDKGKIEKVSQVLDKMIKQGKTIFMIEHDTDFVKQVADTVAFMHNKKIEVIGQTDEVLNNPYVRSAYFGEEYSRQANNITKQTKTKDKIILTVDNLSAGYKKNINVIRDISFSVTHNEDIAIIGKNGAGKSTLAKAIISLVPYKNGSITYDGKDITKWKVQKITKYGIAFFRQRNNIFPNLTVKENLELAAGSINDKHLDKAIKDLSEYLPIFKDKQMLSREASTLSQGQKQQLALGMTLLQKPKIMILDEPSAGLDQKNVKSLYSILTQIKNQEEVSILLIEQNVPMAVAFSDRIIWIKNGELNKIFSEQEKDLQKILDLYFEN